MSSSPAPYEAVAEAAGRGVVGAVELLSVPHWVDDTLALRMLQDIGALNGSSPAVLGNVKALPFIGPAESGSWRIADGPRAFFLSRIQSNPRLFESASGFLTSWFRSSATAAAGSGDSVRARESQWLATFHRAAFDAPGALDELYEFVETASREGRRADLFGAEQLAAQLFTRDPYIADVAYVRGRYLYSVGRRYEAEAEFLVVHEKGTRPAERGVARHLLGASWARRRDRQWLGRAETVLREAADDLREAGDERGVALTLTTLASALMRQRGRLADALEAIQGAEALGTQTARGEELAAVNTHAAILMQMGGDNNLSEAEAIARRGLKEAASLGTDTTFLARTLSEILARRGGEERLLEALELARGALVQTEPGDLLGRVIGMNSTAGILLDLGTPASLDEASELANRSLILSRQLRSARNQAIALRLMARAAEASGNHDEAVRLAQEVVEINEAAELPDLAAAKAWLAELIGRG